METNELNELLERIGADRSGESPLAESVQVLFGRLAESRQPKATGAGLLALLPNPQGPAATGPAAAATAGGGVVRTLPKALPLSPILTGLLRLFGGGGGDENGPAPLPRFELPPAVRVEAGFSEANGGDILGVDYGTAGLPRLRTPAAAAPQVTVQVQAMDSRSFLDHSEEIARAVREAMLYSHSLNDVVTEL